MPCPIFTPYMTQQISICGEAWILLPERAVWWPTEKALLIADVHWGKGGHFRKHGIAIPSATQNADAARLSGIIAQYAPERLIIAGDLFHSRHNAEVEAFAQWRATHQNLHIDFVLGNHDAYTTAHHERFGLCVHPESLAIGPFLIVHDDAVTREGLHTIHGHLHPGVRVPGAGMFPAFCIGERVSILPAFGQFTGCARVDPRTYREVFVVGDGKVMRVK